MPEPLLVLEHVHAGYGLIEVLKGISLHVFDGEIVTLIGANGAGKSTMLMCISRIVPLRRGRILFAGEEVQKLPPHAVVGRGICQAPEGRKIFPRLSVIENLRMGAFTRKDKNEIAGDTERVFELFPILKERRSQPGGTLSGGEQQMLAIGRAFMGRPRLLLLDEPSLGLAPILITKIYQAIGELNRRGVTVLLVEQNARMALRLAHRGYVMETGIITMTDDAKRLLADPRVQAAYLGGPQPPGAEKSPDLPT